MTGEERSGGRTNPIELRFRDGHADRIECSDGESIVEAAERAGVSLPFGCLTGACATCTAQLLGGDVEYRRPPRALKARHREAGYVLPCIAVPRSACVLRVGAGVQAELVSNPWK